MLIKQFAKWLALQFFLPLYATRVATLSLCPRSLQFLFHSQFLAVNSGVSTPRFNLLKPSGNFTYHQV
jgi:hypothetical protein